MYVLTCLAIGRGRCWWRRVDGTLLNGRCRCWIFRCGQVRGWSSNEERRWCCFLGRFFRVRQEVLVPDHASSRIIGGHQIEIAVSIEISRNNLMACIVEKTGRGVRRWRRGWHAPGFDRLSARSCVSAASSTSWTDGHAHVRIRPRLPRATPKSAWWPVHTLFVCRRATKHVRRTV